MARKIQCFYFDPILIEGLRVLKQRDQVDASESVRQAVRAWLKRKGVIDKTTGRVLRSRG